MTPRAKAAKAHKMPPQRVVYWTCRYKTHMHSSRDAAKECMDVQVELEAAAMKRALTSWDQMTIGELTQLPMPEREVAVRALIAEFRRLGAPRNYLRLVKK